MSKFKISGQERRNLKKLLNEFKAFEKNFWYYHQLDKDMCDFISPEKVGEYPMSDEEAQKRYDKVLGEIERITKQLEEKAEKCPICHQVGYHKMSCPTQKMTVFISDENTDLQICNRVNRTDNNRCINCGAKSGHPCQMKPNESNYC